MKKKFDELLKGWKVESLNNIGELQYGYTCSAINKNTGIKLLRITDINKNGKVIWETVPYCEVSKNDYEKYKLNIGDVLFARIGATTGKTAFVEKEVKGVFASYLIKFKPTHKELDTKFLYYFTQSNPYWIQVHKNKEGQLKKGLNAKVLGNIALSLPPLPEQKKIAEILSTVNQGIEKVDEAIKKTKRLKNGLMQELLTKGIGHKEFKDTEIGRMPKEWKLEKISDIAEVKGGKRLPKGHQLVDFKTPYPYIRVVDFRNMGVNTGDIKFLLPETQRLIKQYTISSKDVYISIAGTVGISGLIPSELDGANLTENSAKFCNLRDIIKEYLAYILNSPIGQNQISAYIGKAQQPKLALFRIEKVKVPLPLLQEQQKIAEILSSVDERLELLRKRKERLERVKKGLMNDLLTGRKRVRLEA